MLADRVALLDRGVITATGSHQELLATEPRYRQLMSGTDGADAEPGRDDEPRLDDEPGQDTAPGQGLTEARR
jgi:ATP-binding cassette subfamily B protein